jgi:hypothetical protein
MIALPSIVTSPLMSAQLIQIEFPDGVGGHVNVLVDRLAYKASASA